MMRLDMQQNGAQPVTKIIDGAKTEWVIEPYGNGRQWQVEPPIQRAQHGQWRMPRNWHTTDKQAHGHRPAAAAAVDLPQGRIMQQLSNGRPYHLLLSFMVSFCRLGNRNLRNLRGMGPVMLLDARCYYRQAGCAGIASLAEAAYKMTCLQGC